MLVCELPEEFSGITCGDVDFLIDGSQKIKRHFSENQNNDIYLCGNTLYILLPRRYTSGTSLRVQVGGRTRDGDNRQLVWTSLSETIVFGRSISTGFGGVSRKGHDCHHDNCDNGQTALIRDLVTDAHWHGNLEILNLISIDAEGNFLWDGNPLTISRERIREILNEEKESD